MQALIDFIVRNLLALWPIARVYDWQQAMIVRGGRIRRELSPGLHWRWLFLEEVKVWPSTECVVDLKTGAITTIDDVAVVLSANVGYRLESIRKAWATVWNLEESLRAVAIGRLSSYAAALEWADLTGDRAELERQMLDDLNAAIAEWGLKVTRVHLTDCVKARQHRLFMDVPPADS